LNDGVFDVSMFQLQSSMRSRRIARATLLFCVPWTARLGRLLLCGLLSLDRPKGFPLAYGGLAGLSAFSGGGLGFKALFQRSVLDCQPAPPGPGLQRGQLAL